MFYVKMKKAWFRGVIFLLYSLLSMMSFSILSCSYAFDSSTAQVKIKKSSNLMSWESTRHLVAQYVIYRESYNFENMDGSYQMVWLQSSNNVRSEYQKYTKITNKHSPYHLYGRDRFVNVHILEIKKLNNTKANVKFEKEIHDNKNNSIKTIKSEAIIAWEFLPEKNVEHNPSGFKVTLYRSSPI